MILLCSRIFYYLLSSLIINIVTVPSVVTGVTVWPITSDPNPRVLKIEKYKVIKNKMKMKMKHKIKIKSTVSFSYTIPSLDPSIYSLSKYLLILSIHIIAFTKSVPLLLPFSSSLLYIICILSQNQRPLIRFHWILVALPLLCLLLLLLLFLLLLTSPLILQSALEAA